MTAYTVNEVAFKQFFEQLCAILLDDVKRSEAI